MKTSRYVTLSIGFFIVISALLNTSARAELVHRYSFTSNANDSIGTAHGILRNGAAIVNGRVSCDGSNDYVDLPGPVIGINTFPALSLGLWSTQPFDNQSWSMTAAFGGTWSNGTGKDYLFIATARGDGVSRGAIANTPDQDAPWTDESWVNGPELNDNQEHYYALTLDGSILTFYIDGESQGSIAMGDDTIAGLSNNFVYLARSLYNDDSTLACLIDEFRIYNSALTAHQIQQQNEWGPNIISSSQVEIRESNGTTSLENGVPQDTYTVRLRKNPSAPVTVTVNPPAAINLGAGPGQSIHLTFTAGNWNAPQTVTVTQSNSQMATSETVRIGHTTSSTDTDFNQLYIYDVWVTLQSPAELISIDTAQTISSINEKVYGHFLEHIYHSVNGGLWGDQIWNRSFEVISGNGEGFWTIDNNELAQHSLGTNIRLLFGNTNWTDYEFTCEAQKTGGSEGFLILCRANGNRFYWFNLGGWGNTRHALEKGNPNGSWGEVVSTSVSGSITTGQWYDIRVRCEGNRLRLWLDGNLLIDYTDPSAHMSGQVGLGTWATQARFRNIEVRALNNSLLYSGLPDLPETPLADYWNRYGAGDVTVVGDAFNDDVCVHITNTGANESGVQQEALHVTSQPYTGSFWARGNGGTLMVRLLDGNQTLQKISLGSPTAGWTEFPFALNSVTREVLNATLQVGLTGSGEAWVDQVSLMGQDAINLGGYRPDLLAAVQNLWPPVIRWPGGCFASAYFWKDAIGPQSARKKYQINLWDDQETNAYGTDEFLRMCELIGAEPIIVINTGVLTSTCGVGIPIRLTPAEYLRNTLDWMEYCNGDANSTAWGALRASNGHPEPYHVRYWEIDNETWAAGVNAYINTVRTFVPAMRALDPNIKIIACGSGGYDQGWNRTVIDACGDLIDYISTHHYENADNYKQGPREYEAFIAELGNYIGQSSNPNIKIYMSEWNAQSTDWRTGLYAGGLLNAFERSSDVFEMGGPALFLRHLSATQWDNAFINFDNTGWFPAPNYVVMKLWHDHYAPNLLVTDSEDNDLNVDSTLSEDGQTVFCKLVNPDNVEKTVELNMDATFVPSTAIMEYVAPGSLNARNSLNDPNNVHEQTEDLSINGQRIRFVLPPYSAAVITISR